MLYSTFGVSVGLNGQPPVEPYTALETLLAKIPHGLDSFDTKLVLMDHYEQTYGIFDHERFGEARPLSVVAMHPKEDATSYSKLYRTIWRFAQHRIYERTGLNLNEFLELPHDIVELLFKISTETSKQQDAPLEQIMKDLKKT